MNQDREYDQPMKDIETTYKMILDTAVLTTTTASPAKFYYPSTNLSNIKQHTTALVRSIGERKVRCDIPI